MPTMIALVGDQPLPNFLAVRHFHYDKVLLVFTDAKRQQYEYLKAALQREPKVEVESAETEAHYINQIAQTIDEELTYLGWEKPEQLVFNLTGGTKAMSLAAFQVAQLRDAEMLYVTSQGMEVRVYHSAWSDSQLQSLGQETIPACITLDDVFDLHLGIGSWQEDGPSKDEGGPFEELLARILNKQILNKQRNFSEVRAGVRTLDQQIEMDMVVRLGNHYGIIEAKSGSKGRGMKGLQQLSTAVSLLGAYSRAFYVITVPANPKHEKLRKALGFSVISLQSYDATKQEISSQDEAELLAGIENAFMEMPERANVYV